MFKSHYVPIIILAGIAMVVVTGAPVLGVIALVGVILADHFKIGHK